MTSTIMAFKKAPRRAPEADDVVGLSPVLSDEAIKKLTELFGLLADASRLKIVAALARHGKINVTALCNLLCDSTGKPASQPAVSHHLTLMRGVGLVQFDRDGRHNNYYLNSEYISDLLGQFFHNAVAGKRVLEFEDFCLTLSRLR